MHISSINLSCFRNYKSLDISFPSDGVVFKGPNGSGKTNILEAIHVLCIGRSQRGGSRTEMIKNGESTFCVQGEFAFGTGDARAKASIGFSRDKKVAMSYDERKITSFREWFNHSAIVSFGPDDLRLIFGGPSERRKFLDVLISQIDPDYLNHLILYQKNLLCRNRMLVCQPDDTLLGIYEEKMAEHGSFLQMKRAEIMGFCQEKLTEFYREISGKRETGSIRFLPSVPHDNTVRSKWKNVYYELLKSRRKQDIARGFSTIGSHRDDIGFFLDGKRAKNYGSHGQCRSLVLALRLSSVTCIEKYKKEPMIFLVDDVFSELDSSRIAQVYPLIKKKGQIFMTTPSDNLPVKTDVPHFIVSEGTVSLQ